MNDVTIGTYSMQTDFGLYLPEYTIPSPSPQTKFVSIIGRDGAVDLTNALGLHYDSRKWTLDFKCFNPSTNWHTLISNVMNAIHGKRLNFEFADDSTHYWTGRFNVVSYTPKKGEGTVRIEITSDPFKYKKLSTIVQQSVPLGYDKLPYNFRALSSTGITPMGNSELGSIVGGTVAWNQLCNSSSVTVTNGHKFYMLKNGTETIGASSGTAITGLASGTDIVSDLTIMFGSTIADYLYTLESGTAGEGVAKLKSWGYFLEDYYGNDSGSLQSVNTSAHKTVGFNQWDEEWELGGYNATTGEKEPASTYFRCVNPIRVIPNTTYYYRSPLGGANVYFYDNDGNYLSYINVARNSTFTTPSNCGYMRFRVYSYGTTYNNNICINLSKTSGTPKNGDYVAYAANTYALDSALTLRGIPKLDANNKLYYNGDTYEASGTVTRQYGIVDLGTLTWGKSSSGNKFYATIGTPYFKMSQSGIGAICGKYVYDGNGTSALGYYPTDDKAFRLAYVSNPSASSYEVYIHDEAYTDKNTFKTAMDGVYLVYELATPTTETATAYAATQSIDPDGTEEYVDYAESQGTRDVAIPAGHDTYYSVPITLTNSGGKSVVPTVTASAPMTLAWGNYTYSMQAGTSVIPTLVLDVGTTKVEVAGVGTIKFEYTEASL